MSLSLSKLILMKSDLTQKYTIINELFVGLYPWYIKDCYFLGEFQWYKQNEIKIVFIAIDEELANLSL